MKRQALSKVKIEKYPMFTQTKELQMLKISPLSFTLIATISLASCAKLSVPDVKPTSTKPDVQVSVPAPTPVVVEAPVEVKVLKSISYAMPSRPSQAMLDAADFIKQYGNSDEFFAYVKLHALPLQAGNFSDLDLAIAKHRECFNGGATLKVVWGSYPFWSIALGGWDGIEILQNPKPFMTNIQRAGHWYHETTHYCGFTHEINGKIQNSIVNFPQIKLSWPYQAGYMFEDFLSMKQTQKALAVGVSK